MELEKLTYTAPSLRTVIHSCYLAVLAWTDVSIEMWRSRFSWFLVVGDLGAGNGVDVVCLMRLEGWMELMLEAAPTASRREVALLWGDQLRNRAFPFSLQHFQPRHVIPLISHLTFIFTTSQSSISLFQEEQ
jgi:hypothetical protein